MIGVGTRSENSPGNSYPYQARRNDPARLIPFLSGIHRILSISAIESITIVGSGSAAASASLAEFSGFY